MSIKQRGLLFCVAALVLLTGSLAFSEQEKGKISLGNIKVKSGNIVKKEVKAPKKKPVKKSTIDISKKKKPAFKRKQERLKLYILIIALILCFIYLLLTYRTKKRRI